MKQSGTHDFTYSGREANTVLVTSSDGVHFSEKKLLMGNDAYPPEYTCHVRDPKLWEEDGTVYMVQGGRINGAQIKPACPGEDRGGIIVFRRGAEDVDWPVQYSITTAEAFGYMWECPDYFCIGDIKILSCSPQGLPSLRFKWQNIYQSGYFIMPEGFDITDPLTLKECFGDYRLLENPEKCFREWDMGFDFYAPQTFEDSRGRRILIGWAGMPDADYDNRPTVERGWQHMMTLPRVISADGNVLRQWPAEEIESLRGDVRSTKEDLESLVLAGLNADVLIEGLSAERLSEMAGRGDDKDGYVTLIKLSDTKGELFKLSMERNDDEKGSYILHLLIAERAGRGRTERNAVISELSDVRMLIDASIVEIFINRGECVFTGRFYIDDDPAVQPFDLMLAPAGTRVWEMRKMKLEI